MESAATAAPATTIWVQLDQLVEHPENIDIYGHDHDNQDLVESIRSKGILEPLVVAAKIVGLKDGKDAAGAPAYTILSGHRRARSARMAGGILEVPVTVVEDVDALEALEYLVHANKQRVKTTLQLGLEARALKFVEDQRARKRQSEGGRGGVHVQERVPELGQVRDIVGKAIQRSGRYVDDLLKVVDAITVLSADPDSANEAEALTAILNTKGVRPSLATKEYAGYRLRVAREEDEAAEAPEPGSVAITVAQWKTMDLAAREAAIADPVRSVLNKQNTTSIEWAGFSWNPIVGCTEGCPYCFARDFTIRRPNHYQHGFKPVMYPHRFHAPQNTPVPEAAKTDPRWGMVFTGSMCDLFGDEIPREWIQFVRMVMEEQNQWQYLILTKKPKRLLKFKHWPKNVWLGTTVDRIDRIEAARDTFVKLKDRQPELRTFVSFEPLLERICGPDRPDGPRFDTLEMFDSVIIGAASKSLKLAPFVPPATWYDGILNLARKSGCHVYLKDNWGYRPQEMPGRPVEVVDRAPERYFQMIKPED